MSSRQAGRGVRTSRRLGLKPPFRRSRPSPLPTLAGPEPAPSFDRPSLALPLPGIWCVWDPWAAAECVRRTLAVLELPASLLPAYIERLGVELRASTCWQPRSGVLPPLSRCRVPCPSCGFPQRWIRWVGDRWACLNCGLGQVPRPGWSRTGYSVTTQDRLRLLTARCQFQLVCGVQQDLIVRGKRARPLRGVGRSFLYTMLRGRSYRDCPPLDALHAAAILSHDWAWRQVKPGARGPFWRRVAPYVVDAMIDTFLDRDAYRQWCADMMTTRRH